MAATDTHRRQTITAAGTLTSRLLAHECRHVYEYEMAGLIEALLPLYLQQIAEFTCDRTPYELDARAWDWVGL